jgi:hypothetical protein
VRRLSVLAAGAVAVVTLASPAAGESWNRPDPRHDGFRGGEIAHLAGSNRPALVVARVEFVELRRALIESAFLVVDTRRPQGDDYMLFTRWTGREYRHQLYRTIPFSDADADRIRCPGMSVRWSRRDDVISLAVPQTCLKRPKQHVRLGFYSGGRRADDWTPGSFTEPGPWLSMGAGRARRQGECRPSTEYRPPPPACRRDARRPGGPSAAPVTIR